MPPHLPRRISIVIEQLPGEPYVRMTHVWSCENPDCPEDFHDTVTKGIKEVAIALYQLGGEFFIDLEPEGEA